jgi:hypothetical protein
VCVCTRVCDVTELTVHVWFQVRHYGEYLCPALNSSIDMLGKAKKLSREECHKLKVKLEKLSRGFEKFSANVNSRCEHFQIRGQRARKSVSCETLSLSLTHTH